MRRVFQKRNGHWEPAIEVSRDLARETGVQLDIRPGVAEALPFEDESVDFVNAYSVLEHVDFVMKGGGIYKRDGAFVGHSDAGVP